MLGRGEVATEEMPDLCCCGGLRGGRVEVDCCDDKFIVRLSIFRPLRDNSKRWGTRSLVAMKLNSSFQDDRETRGLRKYYFEQDSGIECESGIIRNISFVKRLLRGSEGEVLRQSSREEGSEE